MSNISINHVRDYLVGLQASICDGLQQRETEATFDRRHLDNERGGFAQPHVLADGATLERAAVNFSHTSGAKMPAAATTRRPELAGQTFQAVSVSLIVHPLNPYAPTCHANFRCFVTGGESGEQVWWFGGGYDLTPFYGFEEDAYHWHQVAQEACAPFGEHVYPACKRACDDYFFLPHRNEPRGIGGLFFDDWTEGGFEQSFAFLRAMGDSFLPAYLPILDRRCSMEFGERERNFQLYRRGRYVEFNLVYDRGTKFGLQSGGRIESILASMPPRVEWHYDRQDPEGSPEARLLTDFLCARDWLAQPSEPRPLEP